MTDDKAPPQAPFNPTLPLRCIARPHAAASRAPRAPQCGGTACARPYYTITLWYIALCYTTAILWFDMDVPAPQAACPRAPARPAGLPETAAGPAAGDSNSSSSSDNHSSSNSNNDATTTTTNNNDNNDNTHTNNNTTIDNNNDNNNNDNTNNHIDHVMLTHR